MIVYTNLALYLTAEPPYGWFTRLPEIGDSFFIEGQPLDPTADVRRVNTSLVQDILSDTTSIMGTRRIEFKTLNSVYFVEYDVNQV